MRNDFEPVSLLATNPLLIVAKKAMPANDLKELIAWLKANPDKASQGTSGAGAATHIAGVFFQKETGTRFQFVPYRGAGPAMQDLMAGQIDMMIDPGGQFPAAGACRQHQGLCRHGQESLGYGARHPDRGRGGIARVLRLDLACVLCAKGHAEGHHRQAQCRGRGGLGRSGGPRSGSPILVRRFSAREQQTPEALGAFHKAEIEKWWPIIKAAGIKAE